MSELTKQEQDSVAADIAAAKERLQAKERATEDALTKAKEDAKSELRAEAEAKAKVDAEAKEKADLQARIDSLEAEKKASEESYKQKLDSVIESQAVVQTQDPFAGSPSQTVRDPVSSLTESQMDDIENVSREAFEEHLKSQR